MGINWFKSKSKSSPTIPANGRSSQEQTFLNSLESYFDFYNIVNPYVPIEILRYITLLSVINSDVSQAIRNWVNIGNKGHKLLITDKSYVKVDRAIERLNEQAYKLYKISAGIDGLINHYFNQLSVSGAISSEDVISDDLKGVKKVVLVPTFSIRFKYENGDYRPYQKVSESIDQGLIKLNPVTYSYYANFTAENSPYALPPMVAAIEPILTQKDMFKNLQYAVKKFGLLGLNVIKIKPLPKKPNESEKEYTTRNQKYLDSVAEATKNNYTEGMLVMMDDQVLEHHSLTSDARGIKDIIQLNEEQVFSGIGIDPAMAGRTYSTTETYASVVYEMLVMTAANMRRLIKRRMEKTYRLDLLLLGIDVTDITLRFNPNKSMKPGEQAQAKKTEVEAILEKVRSGMISPERAAQEAGYDDWFDEKLIKMSQTGVTREFIFKPDTQQYELLRPVYNVSNNKMIKQEKEENSTDEDSRRKLESWIREYLEKTLPYYDQLEEDVVEFSEKFINENVKESGDVSIDEFMEAVTTYVLTNPNYKDIPRKHDFEKTVETIIANTGKHYKEVDFSVFAGNKPKMTFRFGEGDLNAMKFFSRIDNYFFSKFAENKDFGGNIKGYISKFLERGEGTFSGWTKSASIEFRLRFGEDLRYQMERIIDSSINRIRTYSHVEQLYEAGFDTMEVDEKIDLNTCPLCREMHGRLIPVTKARAVIKNFVNADSVSASLEFLKQTAILKADNARIPMTNLLAMGKGFPPYHVRCRGSVKGHFEFQDKGIKNFDPVEPLGKDLDRKNMYEYWKSLTPYERNLKIDMSRKAGISEGFELRGKKNWSNHYRDLPKMNDIEDMKQEAMNVLKNPDRVLLNVDSGNRKGEKRSGMMYNFFKGEGDEWLQVTVDIDGVSYGSKNKPVILHFYGPKNRKPKSLNSRIEEFLKNNKFIEVKNG